MMGWCWLDSHRLPCLLAWSSSDEILTQLLCMILFVMSRYILRAGSPVAVSVAQSTMASRESSLLAIQ